MDDKVKLVKSGLVWLGVFSCILFLNVFKDYSREYSRDFVDFLFYAYAFIGSLCLIEKFYKVFIKKDKSKSL